MRHQEHKQPVLRLVRGGLSDAPSSAGRTPELDEWAAFEQTLGWQPSHDEALPADYEDMLAGRIFGTVGEAVVPMGPPANPTTTKTHWVLLALAVAVAAAVVMAWPQPAPPAASLPTAAPERAPVRTAEPDAPTEPVDAPPPPPEAEELDDPGMRRAERPRPWPVQRRPLAPAEPKAAPPAPPVTLAALHPAAAPLSPDPDPGAAPLPVQDLLVMQAPRLPLGLPLTSDGWARDDTASIPMWTHLGMSAPRSDARAVAVVDVVDAGRKLRDL